MFDERETYHQCRSIKHVGEKSSDIVWVFKNFKQEEKEDRNKPKTRQQIFEGNKRHAAV